MLIGVLSDTHIPKVVKSMPDNVLELFIGVDLIIHAGDIVEMSVIDQLHKLAPVEAVAGNMDSSDVKKVLPEKKIIEAGGFRIGVTHSGGAGGTAHLRAMDAFYGQQVDCIVFGHSHTAFNREYNGILLFNPGSATDRRFSLRCSIGFLEISDKITGRIKYL